ncbi:hypothetical protein EJB05_34395, partial [Eragrostis curvula]
MEAGLSRGALAKIWASEDGAHTVDQPPVLQVTDLRPLAPERCPPLFRMALSDGVRSVLGILPASFNHLVTDSALGRGTVLRLLEYTCTTVLNRRIFIFIQFKIVQTDFKLTEYGVGTQLSSTALRPAKKKRSANNIAYAEYCEESHFACQGIEADPMRKTVAQINAENWICLDQEEFIIVKATPTFVDKENICYTACPLVVNGKQCRMEISRSEEGWWHCNRCNQSFVTCDYRYKILLELKDSTGTTYATASKQAGEDIFGRSAKELYRMKCEEKDCAQFDNIVRGVLFHDFLFKIKFPKCTIVKAGKVNPSTESRCLLREIHELKESSGSTKVCRTSVGSRIGFSYLEAQQRVSNVIRDPYGMRRCDTWDLVSQTGSNSM